MQAYGVLLLRAHAYRYMFVASLVPICGGFVVLISERFGECDLYSAEDYVKKGC